MSTLGGDPKIMVSLWFPMGFYSFPIQTLWFPLWFPMAPLWFLNVITGKNPQQVTLPDGSVRVRVPIETPGERVSEWSEY